MQEPLLDLATSTIRTLRISGAVLGVAVAAFGVWGRRAGLLDHRPGGVAFGETVLPILSIGLVLAVLVAFRWEIVGGALAAFLGAGLAVLALNQLVPWHALALTAAFAIPAVVWVVLDLADLPPRRAVIGLIVVGALAVAGGGVAQAVYSGVWGPTHPESEVPDLADSGIAWAWAGAVTTETAEVRARPDVDGAQLELEVSTDDAFRDIRTVVAERRVGEVLAFRLEGLTPDTEHHYRFVVDGETDDVRTGRFRTFPEGPASFTVAIGACARVGSNGAVFDAIRRVDPLVYLAVGDLHYGDNNRDDIGRFREVMDLTLAVPAQSALYRSTSIA